MCARRIGYNAFYYPNGNAIKQEWPSTSAHDPTYGRNNSEGLAGGLPQLGFSAAASGSVPLSGNPPMPDRFTIGNITMRYLTHLVNATLLAGIDSDR